MMAMSKSYVGTVVALLGHVSTVPVSDDDTQCWAESSDPGPLSQIGEHPADRDRICVGRTRARQRDNPDHLAGGIEHGSPAVALVDLRPVEVEHVVVLLRCGLPGTDPAAGKGHA